jgi:hypothetical protein
MTAKTARKNSVQWQIIDLAYHIVLPRHLPALLVLRYLAKKVNSSKLSYPSYALISASCGGIGNKTIAEAIRYLCSLKLISYVKGTGNQHTTSVSNKYMFNIPAMRALVRQQGIYRYNPYPEETFTMLVHGKDLRAKVKSIDNSQLPTVTITDDDASSPQESASSPEDGASSLRDSASSRRRDYNPVNHNSGMHNSEKHNSDVPALSDSPSLIDRGVHIGQRDSVAINVSRAEFPTETSTIAQACAKPVVPAQSPPTPKPAPKSWRDMPEQYLELSPENALNGERGARSSYYPPVKLKTGLPWAEQSDPDDE